MPKVFDEVTITLDQIDDAKDSEEIVQISDYAGLLITLKARNFVFVDQRKLEAGDFDDETPTLGDA